MKKMSNLILIAFILSLNFASAQCINWNNFDENQKTVCSLNAGLDYGLVFGGSISKRFQTKWAINNKKTPLVVSFDYSFPSSGKKQIADDFKMKLGVQSSISFYKSLVFSIKLQPIYRQLNNAYISAKNYGSEISFGIGYYRPKWFGGIEFGFDNALITYYKPTHLYKEIYPSVADKWYEFNTGGNFFVGLQAGVSIKRFDFTFEGGKLIQQDFKTNPLIPLYFQVGVNYRIKSSKRM